MSERNVLGPARAEGPGGGARAPKAPLGKDLRPVLPGQVRRQNRAVAHRMRRVLQGFTTIDRLKACGRVPVNAVNGGAVIRGTETAEGVQAGVAGLMRCGSPWACPVCARRIAAERASDIAEVLQRTADEGGSAALLTLTSRHGRKDRLEAMWDAIGKAWGAVTSGRGWIADRDLFGVRGTIRTVEYTHSEDNGHHLHVHAVIVFEQPLSPEMMEEFGHRCFGRWSRALQRRGFDAVAEKGGLDVRPIRMTASSIEQVAEYVSKAAFEVSGGVSKRGRCSMAGQDGHDCSKAPCSKKSRSAFEILADAVQGEEESIRLWWVWEKASLGRKQVTWSRGLRDWARLGREKSEEEIVSEDLKGEDLFVLPAETWEAVRDEVEDLLDVIELEGVEAGERWLRSRGLAFSRPDRK